MRFCFCVAVTATLSLAAEADDPKKDPEAKAAREIDVKAAGGVAGKPTEPTVIATDEELAKSIDNKDALAAIRKAVDFSKDKVLYFRWAGSGMDKLGFTVDSGEKMPMVKFTYTPGKTRDLRQHGKLFAMPKDAKFEVKTQR
ncbi:MAG TPA: hypothetical protein VKE40_16115 [Gemmataceae bacterium]|nr:hypothetical protein [Gemmataceae bacterium]